VRPAAHHIESLDAFRGVTVAAMILVNNPGDWTAVYPSLMHANWDGCTFADLVFPSFVFIMGFAMPLAFRRRRERGDTVRHLDARVAKRALALAALGLILNLFAAWHAPLAMRVPGVLQRIAAVYLVTAFVLLRMNPRTWAPLAALLMMTHWALLVLVPFGSFPAGTVTPEHNISGYVDRLIFGRHTLSPFGDPEGILGTITAVATALLGAAAGEFVRRTAADRTKVIGLAGGGAALIACGLGWSRVLPLNKPLWTGSYVLVASGAAAAAFAVFYLIVDVAGLRIPMRPFVWLGVNPLAIYFVSELVGHAIEQGLVVQHDGQVTTPKAWVFWRVFAPFAGDATPAASLGFALTFAAVFLGIASVLHRRGIRIHV
jgi:predicted acyltransferase